jgi:uncharacterized ion transporter superfamily protein YfcC
MEQKSGAQISAQAFLQSAIILFVLMMLAGILTLIVPAGSYARVIQDGRAVIDPKSFQLITRPDYPIWRWFTAPIEVLGSSDGLTVIIIIVFLLMVGCAFAVLDKSGILNATLARLVKRFGARKYALLLIVPFFFMLIGAFFGIFEEVVPLVPLMIALAYLLGWDSLTGLGMSILATNLGFSAAMTNPFTIGIAQKIAGLPLFSGIELRVPIFLAIYAALAIFLVRHARRVEQKPESSPVFDLDRAARAKFKPLDLDALANPKLGRAIAWFASFLVLILLTLIAAPFVPDISDLSLPLVGLFFLIGGVGAGLISGAGNRVIGKAMRDGITGIAPGVPLILMAVSVKHIVAQGGIMDTILYNAAQTFSGANPFFAALAIYALALVIEIFVASASAKSFLLMPILLPLADLVGVTRQTAVTAYCFGDGFTNLAYPTNPVLLIALGLTVVSYPKWLRWTLGLWFWIALITIAFLALAVAIRFGPF